MVFGSLSTVKIIWQELIYFESVSALCMELYPPTSYEGARIRRVNMLRPALP